MKRAKTGIVGPRAEQVRGYKVRMRTVLLAALAAGVIGSFWTTSQSTLVIVGFGAFWAGVVFVVLMWARLRSSDSGSITAPPAEAGDPWTDEQGVQRFPGDVFDIANHPHPGKHSRP
jgi:hypothetical protein